MKILYIAPIRLPTEKAHGIQIMETCAALVRAGAEVELVIPGRHTPIKEDPFTYYAIKERFPITTLPVPDTVWLGRFGFLFHVLTFGIRAAHYARRSNGVAYTRDPMTVTILSFLGVKRLAWEVHTSHAGVPRAVLTSVRGVIPITKGLALWYRARGVLEEALHVAPDAVSLRAFGRIDRAAARASLHEKLGIPVDANIALYVGSFGLYAWKGIDIARDAAARVPQVTWLFVGGTPEECEAFTQSASPNVRTLPRARREDMPALISAADVLLLPNKSGEAASERDTSPMKLFEYMASGVPIVASDIPSLREVLNERNSFLVRPNEPSALARGVREALADTEASRRAKMARADVESYTWDRRAENLLAFLRRRVPSSA